MSKKILIFGFPHCGTSILKSIICHIDDIEEIVDETYKIDKSSDKKYILCKFPLTKAIFFTDLYKDYIKIFIMRNPVYVISSLNKRFNYKLPWNNRVPAYIQTLRYFIYMRECGLDNLYAIKYEEIFDNNYEKLRLILDKIGFNYTDDIFDNSKYLNKTISGVELEKNMPDKKEHAKYRTWQINQPFVLNNDISKIDLTDKDKLEILNSKDIMKIYPEIKHILK